MNTFLKNLKRLALTGASPLWSLYLKLRGCSVGKNLIAMGRPGINKRLGSLIQLGNRVILCSNEMANPVARGGRCRLATLTPTAKIILKDGVGMSSSLICSANLVEIGEGTIIGGGCMIFDTDFHPRYPDGTWYTDELQVSAPVIIGKKCFVGARSIILKGVTIGDFVIIGAGSTVTKSIPSGAVVAGNPTKLIRIEKLYSDQ